MSNPASSESSVRAWLELIRPPNLFTVPGDVLAGAFFAMAAGRAGLVPPGQLAAAVAASVAVYAAGLIDNDLVDFAEDVKERPGRPLPSGRVSRSAASTARTVLFAVPFLLVVTGFLPPVWFLVQALLVTAVLAYNRIKQHYPAVGFLLMGFCRGLNLLGGAVLSTAPEGGWGAIAAVAACWVFYVAGLTLFAANETSRAPGAFRYLLLLPTAALGLVGWLPGLTGRAIVALVAAAVAGSASVAEALWKCPPGAGPAQVPRTVGRLVRTLIPMQALLCLGAPARGGAPVAAALLLGCWFLSERLGRRFYAS